MKKLLAAAFVLAGLAFAFADGIDNPFPWLLASGKIWVGQTGGQPAAVSMSGDVTLAANGAATVGAIGGKAVSLGAALTTTGAGAPTLAFPGSTYTFTFPANSGTIPETDYAFTWTAVQKLPGDTTSETSPGSGIIGEVQDSGVAGPTSLTTATPKTIASLSLPAGHWSCSASDYLIPAGTTTTSVHQVGVSLTNNGFDGGVLQGEALIEGLATAAGGGNALAPGPRLINVTSTTSLYAVVSANFAVSTMQADAELVCVRIF